MNFKILLITLLTLTSHLVHAENLATVLRGKIISNNLSGMQIIMKESDGSILDMSDISKNGNYNLDLTIMDTPSLTEVDKLTIEVKDISGKIKVFHVNEYMSVFADTVYLKPITIK